MQVPPQDSTSSSDGCVRAKEQEAGSVGLPYKPCRYSIQSWVFEKMRYLAL